MMPNFKSQKAGDFDKALKSWAGSAKNETVSSKRWNFPSKRKLLRSHAFEPGYNERLINVDCCQNKNMQPLGGEEI